MQQVVVDAEHVHKTNRALRELPYFSLSTIKCDQRGLERKWDLPPKSPPGRQPPLHRTDSAHNPSGRLDKKRDATNLGLGPMTQESRSCVEAQSMLRQFAHIQPSAFFFGYM